MKNALSVSTPSDREIRLERILSASRERVWRALTEPALLAQWWGRGNKLVIERMVVEPGGHWRYVEHTPQGKQGFEGRYREVSPPERLVATFEWDGMPGHVAINTMTLEDLGDGRTKLVSVSQFHTVEERDGMLHSGMETGAEQSYQALERVLAANPSLSTALPAVQKIAFTMYPVKDVARARGFYENTLGLTCAMAGNFGEKHWVEYDLPGGGCLALTNTTGDAPSQSAGGTIALEVTDIEVLMAHLAREGVTLLGEVVRGPHCTMRMCLDSEGNSLLLHQLDR